MTSLTGVPTWVSDLAAQAEASTRGPWYVRRTDDASFMTAYYVTCERGAGALDVDKWDHARSVVAMTVLQDPGLALTPEGAENANFIAAARTGVPRLCGALARCAKERQEAVEALRALVDHVARGDKAGHKAGSADPLAGARRLIAELGAE